MGVSTLDEINTAVYNYIGGILYGSYPDMFPTLNRIIFSVTADDESIIRRFEEKNQDTSKKVDLPAAAIIFNGFRHVTKPYAPRYKYQGSTVTEGKSSTGTFAEVQLNYQVRAFTSTMADLLKLMELWVLFVSTNRLVHYHSDLLDTHSAVELTYEIPKMSTLPNVSERWGGRGFIYSMDVDIEANSIIATVPSASLQISRILKLVAHFKQQGSHEDVVLATKTIFADKPTDVVTETSEGV